MTDTGQVPAEGLPENAGLVEQPGVAAPGAYTYLDPSENPAGGVASAEDDDLLLMPGAQGAWSEPQTAPQQAQGAAYAVAPQGSDQQPVADPSLGGQPVAVQPQVAQAQAAQAQLAQAQAAHQPGPHETAGRDSGSVDLNGVQLPGATGPAPASHAGPARRPLYRGPSGPAVPDGTGSPVRSLADRGPAGAPQHAVPARHAGPPTVGPEYLDIPRDGEGILPGPQLGEIPPQGATPWTPQPQAEQVGQAEQAEQFAQPSQPSQPSQHGQSVAPAETVVPDATPAPQNSQNSQNSQNAQAAPVAQDAQVPQSTPDVLAPEAPQPAPAAAELPEPTPAATATPVAGPPAAAFPQAADGGEPAFAAEALDVPGAQDADQPAATGQAVLPPVADQQVPVPEASQEFPLAPEDAQLSAVGVPAHEAAAGQQQFAVAAAQPWADAAVPGGGHLPHAGQGPQIPQAVPHTDAPMAPAPAPLGQFVPVEGSVPSTPHLAPTPPQPVAVPPEHFEAQQPAEPEPAAEAEAPAPAPQADAPETPGTPEAPAPVEVVEAPQVVEVPEIPEVIATAEAPEPAPQPAATVPAPRDAGDSATATPVPDMAATPVPDTAEEPIAAEAPEPAAEAAEPEAAAGGEAEAAAEAEPAAPVEPTDETAPAQAAEPAEPVDPAQPTHPAESAAAPGYDDAEREAVLRVMRERRDIRNGFRGDPIPHEVLLRVLEAAHTAPSVGHSQPWDFVVIRSAETRRTMHELAMRQKDAYAKSLPKGRAKQFKELKIEAILDTPVNIVVTADPTRGGRHTLGRHTQPQMAPYSSALAVENLWLAARAEGLGVGWVSFFDEREMVRTLGLPEHLEVVAYLCVGYVDEFPEEPELMQAGWSKRRPLSWVVHEETYGRRALPGEDPHDLLAETVSNIRPLDAKALGEAWERQKRMTKPPGALGMLEIISAQLSGLSRQCPPPIPEPAAVAIFAGDHGVHAQGVTAWPQEVTAQMVANFLGGGAVCNAFANQVGAEVCVIDVGVASELPATPGLLPRKVRAGTADMTTGPALTREEVKAAIEVGIETARDLVAAGNKALLTGEMGIANTTASAALISVYTDVDAAEVTGRGTGINDEMHARKVEVVRRALDLHKPDPADPIGVLAAIGGLEHAAMVGLLLGGASLRTPVILDGVSAGAAALVARAIAPEVLAACIAGHRSAEPGHVAALNKLGLRPLVDLDLRLGEGTGALLALPVVQSAARAMHEVATFDSAGVTEK
ncbi:nicotinate-nucleotide--dimethylbenzimidazole phosphoribosyltransferase [Streptomyces sp. MZ04]|uniref:nicotinate-nucleotide--dimethylbenzimidazole phosphoribosyltransferase n=1 Tax=Streptomyces sp. MZ04 TaxID=2559236 RepID=UPI00107ECDD0|nr:nicotinate-nucleotide--dimethylbenzimidazole phosphoribosyltransferase [Streptomyces sp. MZ04]TGB13682.1 nicotinate-nucleotide--dimethylbenzimidazole phosphoribosyltransferase [Streptomyces sp. MZ04]